MVVTYGIDCGRLIDALDALGTGLYCNSFSTRGKRQTKEVDLFKQAIGQTEHSKALERFCKELFQGISVMLNLRCLLMTGERDRIGCSTRGG